MSTWSIQSIKSETGKAASRPSHVGRVNDSAPIFFSLDFIQSWRRRSWRYVKVCLLTFTDNIAYAWCAYRSSLYLPRIISFSPSIPSYQSSVYNIHLVFAIVYIVGVKFRFSFILFCSILFLSVKSSCRICGYDDVVFVCNLSSYWPGGHHFSWASRAVVSCHLSPSECC